MAYKSELLPFLNKEVALAVFNSSQNVQREKRVSQFIKIEVFFWFSNVTCFQIFVETNTKFFFKSRPSFRKIFVEFFVYRSFWL